MIYIDRKSVEKPKYYQKENTQKLRELMKAHYKNPENIVNQTEFKSGSWTYREHIEVLATLIKLFNNKCAFCESLLKSDVLERKNDSLRRPFKGLKYISKASAKKVDELTKKVDILLSDLKERWREEKDDPIMGEFFNAADYKELQEISDPYIISFRPKNWATDNYGRGSFEHYWWLEYEWENTYLSCESCASQKGNRFPVKGNRIFFGQATADEDALLIDPCRIVDFEEEDISFDNQQAIPHSEYGETTIEVMGLNRPALVENRSVVLQLAKTKMKSFLSGDKGLMYSSGNLFSTGQPYFSGIISYARLSFTSQEFDRLLEVISFQDGMNKRKEKLKKNAKTFTMESLRQVSDNYYSKSRSYSLDTLVNEEKSSESNDRLSYFRSSKWIGKVEIENFKNIKKLTLDFPRKLTKNEVGNESMHPWLVLLGENGVGKSSVLQAVAMTLMGQKRLDDFNFEASEYVTRGAPERSTIKVYLTDRPNPIILTIEKEGNKFVLNNYDPQVILMGYGATRLLTKDKDRGFTKDFIRTKNLFDPFEQLDNVQDWLREPEFVDDDLFEAISQSLGDLLMLKADGLGKRFFREKVDGKLQILFEKERGEKIPLNYLSSGYKAVIALALDIMVGLFQIYGEGDRRTRLQEAEGIALIDEIGVHLHPQWKMWIVGALRRTFPKMNFIITTHEPLCLRGLEKGEVFVVNLDEENGVKVITDLPAPKDLRIDQLLTSSYFGLNSVLDPEVERKFDRFYQLQAMGSKLTIEQQKEFEVLEPQIMERKIMLGSTVKEEIEYTVIKEKFEHFSKEENNIKPEEIEEEIITKLKEKWDDALFD